MNTPIKTILLAEDNMEEYVNFISAINTLSPSANIIRADDGYTLSNLLQTPIELDAIFLDINMKYKNGLLCLKEIRSIKSYDSVPVIMLSQSDFIVNIKLAFEYGANFFVRKPASPSELMTLLSAIFSSTYFSSGTQPPYESFYLS